LWKLIPSEHEDLWQEDIPIFVTKPISRDVWDSRGKQICNFFEKSSLEVVTTRLHNLSPDDCDRQVAYIQASLATIERGDSDSKQLTSMSDQSSNLASDEELLNAALHIGEKIEKMCVSDKSRVGWIGFVRLADDKWVLSPVTPSLYDGISGIALFLAYLAKIFGEEKFRVLAHRALVTILEGAADEELGIGAFSGLAGVIYWTFAKRDEGGACQRW
jgi:lantibiotic modifying enzyme